MGLEAATYVTQLDATNPTGADKKKQGDDHLRLIKSTLKNTFPNASKTLYFPSHATLAGNTALGIAYQNAYVACDTGAGDFTITLPALGAGDAGWACSIYKFSSDANGVVVVPPSGTIFSKAGFTTSIRVGVQIEPAFFEWNGSAYIAWKPGAVIGAVYDYDGATLPPGYLYSNGAVFNAAVYVELNAILGTNVLRDRRGRTSVGLDNMGGAAGVLTGATAGAALGVEAFALAQSQLPSVNFNVSGITLGDAGHFHYTVANTSNGPSIVSAPNNSLDRSRVTGAVDDFTLGGTSAFGAAAGATDIKSSGISVTSQGVAASGGSGLGISLVQPSLAAPKIIRAC